MPPAKPSKIDQVLGELAKMDQILAELRAIRNCLALALPRAQANLTLLESIAQYLRQQGTPQLASEIIAAVGEERRQRDPKIHKPFLNVYKSLEHHDRHNHEIVCVEWEGNRLKRGTFKPKPRRSVPGGRADVAQNYLEPPNLFWFRDEISTARRH